jgi:hypothetical protein
LGVDAAGQSPAHHKGRLLKSPLGEKKKIVKWAQEDVKTLYNLLNNNNLY